MDGFYEKNISALKEYQPQFEMSESSEAVGTNRFVLTVGSDGLPNVKCLHNGADIFIHGENNCLHTAEIRTDQVVLENGGLIVSFGCGFGYEAREIIKKMAFGSSFIIMEPSREIFELALRSSDMTDIISAPNVYILPPDGDNGQTHAFLSKFVNSYNYKSVAAFVISPYADLFFAEMRDLFFTYDKIRSSFETSEITVQRFTSVWQANALLNAKHNINSYLVSDFYGKLPLPAVIVSAGPSLAKNIGELKGMEDKALIISVDTALSPLLKNGITPHFVVSADAQDIVAKKFENLDYSHIPLLYMPTSCHTVVSQHLGTKILSPIQDMFYTRLLKSLGKDSSYLDVGGSVSTLAFSFAQHSGCNPIILVGQDLAYTDMKSHTEGAVFEHSIDLNKLLETRGALTVKAVGGGNVYTDNIFQTYASWLQAYAASDKAEQENSREYIDATEGGMKLDGFIDMRLSDALSRYAVDGGVLKHVADSFESAPLLSAAEKKHMRDAYKSAAAFVESIKGPAKTTSKKLVKLCSLLSQKNPSAAMMRTAYSKIAPFEARIKSNEDKLELIGIALAPVAEKLNNEFENAELKTDKEKNKFAASCYAKYYGEVAEISESLTELLKKTLD